MEETFKRSKCRTVDTGGCPGTWTLKKLGQKVKRSAGRAGQRENENEEGEEQRSGPDGDGNSRTVGLVNFRRGSKAVNHYIKRPRGHWRQ